jgi:hypothetical protein
MEQIDELNVCIGAARESIHNEIVVILTFCFVDVDGSEKVNQGTGDDKFCYLNPM